MTPARLCPICELRLDDEVCPTDQVPTIRADFDEHEAHDPAIGTVVAGRYRVERLIGQGGIGRVYAATQLSMGREVALKLLQPHLVRERRQVRRFYREARAATRLTSQHVVRVHDYGVDDDSRTPFIAMELLRGETLRSWIVEHGPAEPAVAARILAQVGRALVEASASGIVHRDLKPANIVIVASRDGTDLVKVTDFGVAKDLEKLDTETLTAQGSTVGTPAYMAPEQVSGGEVGPAADLYALGCILYELLSGRRPFESEGRAGLLVDHLLKAPAPLVGPLPSGAEMPGALTRLLGQLLEKQAEARPASARHVVEVLEAVADGRAIDVVDRDTPTPPVNVTETGAVVSAPAAHRTPARWRRWVLAAGLGLAVGATVLVASTVDEPNETTDPSQAERAGSGITAATAPNPSAAVAPDPPAAVAPEPTTAETMARPGVSAREAPGGDRAAAVEGVAPDPAPVSDSTAAPLPTGTVLVERLVVRGATATIHLHQGDPRPLQIEGDATRLSARLEDRRLLLTVHSPDKDQRQAGDVELHVWSPRWVSVKVAGGASIVSAGRLKTSGLSLSLTGLARLSLDLDVDALSTSLRGSSEAVLRGRAKHHDARTGGAARLEAQHLATQETVLVAAGTSEVKLHAEKQLDVRNDGTGEIVYLGDPVVRDSGDGIRRAQLSP